MSVVRNHLFCQRRRQIVLTQFVRIVEGGVKHLMSIHEVRDLLRGRGVVQTHFREVGNGSTMFVRFLSPFYSAVAGVGLTCRDLAMLW